MSIIEIDKKIPPNDILIQTLEKILKEAKSGELRSFVGCGLYNNRDIGNYHVMEKGAHIYSILGALTERINYCIEVNRNEEE